MPAFKKQIELGAEPEVEMVKCRVTKRGHGKISTGYHDATHGEQFYEEGEELDLPRDIADELASDKLPLNAAGEIRMYVQILTPKAAKA